MEIAVQSIFILFFVALPGVIFRRFYFQGEFTKQFDSKGWSYSLFLSLIFGLGIHLILFTIFYYYGYVISVSNLHEIIVCVQEIREPLFTSDLEFSLLFWYLGLLFIAPMFLGFAFHSIVRLMGLDIKYSLFRFSNHWHYYFKGEIRKHRDFQTLKSKRKEKVLLTRADILCKEKDGENCLFTGILSQYTICKQTGRLDYIYITLPSKYKNFVSSDSDKNISSISGDCLIISASSIININLKYLFRETKNADYGKLFRTILSILYFINWVEPLTISKFGVITAIAIKLIRHLFIFSAVNAIHSSVSKNLRGDTRIGFWFLTLLCLGLYLLSRYFLELAIVPPVNV